MPAISKSRLAELLLPYVGPHPGDELLTKLGLYLDLLLRWNARTNLTAIREPEEIVTRHFGESLFAAFCLRDRLSGEATLLDFGSGAGFPGIPIQLALPELACCLAESQGKKAAFLRESVRALGLDAEVWDKRVEDMPDVRRFDCVTLRAVDGMRQATVSARSRVAKGGTLLVFGSKEAEDSSGFDSIKQFAIPESHSRVLYLYR